MIANLPYRVAAHYRERHTVLGASAGVKHFGTRRLGRSGLDIHGAYFVTDATIQLMRQILCGLDRAVLETLGVTKGGAWPETPKS